MMGRTAVGCLALLCVLSAGCGDDDDDGAAGGGGGAAANGGNSSSSGSGGSRAGSGGTGQNSTAGTGGSKAGTGSVDPGTGARGGSTSGGSGAGTSGGASCDLKCPDGQQCELVQVTCIRAPCNPVPECVPAGGQAGAGSGDQGDTCGTRGTGTCADGFYCKFPAGADCGRSDAGGTCETKPGGCTLDYNPVCGCDGNTYGNPCAAASAGVSVESEGECEQASTVDCDHRKAVCRMLPLPCPDGQVRAVQGACFGDCVNVDRCACSEAAACPQPDSYTCHMSAGHCGPFV